jgi:2-polyprenyl-3-methyl-5-hydroxy-6-metoxy-1,4-benzoquinol methylase
MKPFTARDKVAVINRFITDQDTILDVGFWGQGKTFDSPTWPHALLRKKAKDVYGIDIFFDEASIPLDLRQKYQKSAAEDFHFEQKFDVIFAGDLIEHLVNPGLFLENVKRHLKPDGKLIITTPNAFNLFVIAGKIANFEPAINHDHTFYFNRETIKTLLKKCGFEISEYGYMYTLDYTHKESLKKKVLNALYRVLSFFTPKYYESLVVVAKCK